MGKCTRTLLRCNAQLFGVARGYQCVCVHTKAFCALWRGAFCAHCVPVCGDIKKEALRPMRYSGEMPRNGCGALRRNNPTLYSIQTTGTARSRQTVRGL
eukprot:1348246-Pyramimonas_sp.AAC.1